ncbi:uncharacterized protein RAG0_12982 [Rhynchosporium agropyri]|uniref:SAM domain-containing protein n=2 Tax=Rhynchosporium TaxID=38037 RepID=A0A1E1MA76_RHYSE|nr:uncharacterized protein RAG0_12982 [Rhynchosporium agropyri]CZT46009.1 uncharacterized protein RSE6_06377 [Rhynchosporium secalis]
MTAELEAALMSLGLEEYLERFQESGFKDWESLSKIAESQLSSLDVRLGHRRRLQRAIASGRLWPENTPLPRGPDLNQRIRDWLVEEIHTPEGSDFPESESQTSAPAQADLMYHRHGSQTSSENSSLQSIPSEGKVLSEQKPRSLVTTGNTSGSKSTTLRRSGPKDTGQGVT